MAVKVPSVGQLAFKGNIRRALKKLIAANKSLGVWFDSHPNWPIQPFTNAQYRQLKAIASTAQADLTQKVPPLPQT